MAWLVALCGVFIIVVGLVGVLAPQRLMRWVRVFWKNERSLYTAAGIRVALGSALILAAPATKFPALITVLGVAAFVVGVALVVIGFERMDRFIRWWQRQPLAVVRIGGALAAVFGGLLTWAGV